MVVGGDGCAAVRAEAAGIILQQVELFRGGRGLSFAAGSVARRRLNLIDARTGWTGGKILRMKTKKRKKKSVEILILPGELQRSRRVAAPAPGVNPSRRLSFGADSEKPDKKHVFPPCMLLPRPEAPPVSKMRQPKRMARDLYDLMILPGGPSVKAWLFAEIRGKIKFPAAAGRNLALCLPLIY